MWVRLKKLIASDEFRNMARHVTSIAGLNLLSKLIFFVGVVYLTRALGPTENGKLAFLASLQVPLSRISPLGLDPIAVRVAHRAGADRARIVFQEVNRIRFIFSLILGLFWISACLGWLFFGTPAEYGEIGLYYSVGVCFAGVNLFAAAQYFQKLPQLTARDVITSLVYVGLVLAVIQENATATSAAMIVFAVSIVALVFNVLFGKTLLGTLFPRKGLRAREISWTMGIWTLIMSLSAYGYTLLEIPIVTMFYGLEETGIYKAASSIPVAVFIGVIAVGQVLYPKYVRLAERPLELMRFCGRLGWFMMTCLLVSVLIIFPAGGLIMEAVFGQQFASGGVVLSLLFLANIAILWVQVWTLPLLAMGREKSMAAMAASVSIGALALNGVAGLLNLGMESVAVIHFGSELAMGSMCYLHFRAQVTGALSISSNGSDLERVEENKERDL